MSDAKTRSARRRADKTGRPNDVAGLRVKLAQSRARGMPRMLEDRGRRLLDAYLGAVEAEGLPFGTVLADLASGSAARKIAAMTGQQMQADPPRELAEAACSSGCAFCCILLEGDGGLLTESEARQFHTALHPLAGQPDGRQWNAHACAALDPQTRLCRVYDARPTICRSFLSVDVEACQENAEGGDADGSGVLGNHLDYLAVLALSRDLLKGRILVNTYGLDALARATVEGKSLEDALDAARHRSAELDETCRDIGNSPS